MGGALFVLAGCGGGAKPTGGEGDDDGIAGDGGTAAEDGATVTSAGEGSAEGGDTTSAVSAADDDTPGDEGPPPVKLDLGSVPDAPPGGACAMGGGGKGDLLYSYIWIANSSQNTVSKINTQTLVEEGRYYTRPDTSGSPSRTSVNLNGDVAVANRSGGLTKFNANVENCLDADGSGSVETSSGAGDILPFDDEECRAWHTPFSYTSQRPVAWTSGEWNAAACKYENEKVWSTGVLGGVIEVILVDGETGMVEDSVMVPEVAPGGFGFYGGAVDAAGNFWASQLGGGQLIRVNFSDLSDYDLWTAPYGGYGMTVGPSGYVFTCAGQVGRFDPATETWTGMQVGGGGGCMEDANGILWMANSPLVGVDVETLDVVYSHPLPQYVHGVSVDFDGSIWGVNMSASAYKVDPITGTYDQVDGLVGPYTYSDMTGFALFTVGGGIPSG
ncbi:MAG: hypothetical protein AAF721_26935 [Myxococcota bacterium]